MIEPDSEHGITLEMIRAIWPQVQESINAKDRIVGAVVKHMEPVISGERYIIITSPYRFHCQRMREFRYYQITERVVKSVFGYPFAVFCINTYTRPGDEDATE